MAERIVGRPWTAHEDRLLVNAVAIHGEADNWKAVAHCVPGRTNKACRKRWLHSLSPNVKKSAWTPEEDHLLLELYKVHSTKWSVIARHIPGRTDDACSKRYREALDPSLRRDQWSKEEDDKLLDAYSRLLGRWGQVGQELQRSGLACRNRWRLLERKRTTLHLIDPQPVTVSNPPLTMPSDPALTYPHSPPWPSSPILDPRQYWEGNLLHFDVGPSSASGQQQDNHIRSHNDVGLLGSVEPSSVSHPQSVPHVVNRPPPFHYSSSSLSSALSSPRTLLNRYEKSTAATGCYHIGEPYAAPVPIASAAANASAVFDYRPLDPSLANTSQSTKATDYIRDRPHPVYENCVGQYDGVRNSVAPTPAHSPILTQHASEYHSPAPHHKLIGDGDASPSEISPDSCYPHPSASQGPSIPLVSSGLGPIHEATGNYYAAHRRQGLEHDLRHFVMSSSDSPAVSNIHSKYYVSPSSSDLCSPVSPVDATSRYNRYYPPSEDAVPAHQDFSSLTRPATELLEGCGDYYQSQPSGQSQPQFHSPPNEPEHSAYRTPVPVAKTGPPPTVPRNVVPAVSQSDQHSVSVTPSAYTFPRVACVLPKATGSVAKRGRPLDPSLPNSDDPNPRPTTRPRPSVMRKRPDLHAPLRLSSDLPAANDPAVKPYACGHESCWPANAAGSLACYTTSRGLSDHNKSAHPEDAGGDRPYRCGLDGCGKTWKSINGLQYHLQISKAHFQHAIVSTFVSSYIDGLTVPSVEVCTGESDDKIKKQYCCPHQGCPNRYKQLSGLRYHLAHGHPLDLPVQLDLVPPALSRKLAEKMRKEGSSSKPPDAPTPVLSSPDSTHEPS